MSRRYYDGMDFRRTLNIDELRRVAMRRLPEFAFEYIEGGAEDERALHWNRAVFDRLRFMPRTLVNTEGRHCRTRLFGMERALPLIIAPTGINGMLWRNGDIELARAAALASIPFCLSTMSNARIERVAAEAGCRLWMQLYVFNDKRLSEDIVARAERAECEALMFTTDANVFGSREWDRRSYRRAGVLTMRKSVNAAMRMRWWTNVLFPKGMPRFENVADFFPLAARSAKAGVTLVPKLFHPTIDWDDVARLRDQWRRRLILKGVLSIEDAQRAVSLGCDAIVLSNHGGRQLDSCVSPMDVLKEIASNVGDRIAIVIDSGFRRGSDVVKALALGADAVMLGRAVLYGLAAGGEPGVSHALGLLRGEIDRTLGQLGCRAVADLHPNMLRAD